MATYKRKPLPIDHKKSRLWALASLGSAGIGIGGVQLFDLVNRATHRAHRLAMTTGGIGLGTPFNASFGSSDYVDFTTPQDVNFFDFQRLKMTVRETNVGIYSWTTVSFWGMSVKIAGGGLNIPGIGVSQGEAEILFSDGTAVGNPNLEIMDLPIPVSPPPRRTTDVGIDEKLVFQFNGDVLFDFDRYLLKPGQKTEKALISMTHTLSSWAMDHRFLIVGHTDSVGKATYNKALSKKRAETVKAWIMKNTTHKMEWFKTDGRGEEEPLASNATAEGRAQNRRVEIYGMVPRVWKDYD